jgi:hypothetical protein
MCIYNKHMQAYVCVYVIEESRVFQGAMWRQVALKSRRECHKAGDHEINVAPLKLLNIACQGKHA